MKGDILLEMLILIGNQFIAGAIREEENIKGDKLYMTHES